MRIEKLYLKSFRNFNYFDASFEKTNIILGPNASGKSNLIEAIYLLCAGKSFKARQRQELITFGSNFCQVTGRVLDGDRRGGIEISLHLDKRTNTIRRKTIRRIRFLSVFFAPSSLDLILGPPSYRRQSLDLTLSLISKKYLKNLNDFFEILKQRNRLLYLIQEGRAKGSQLDFWDKGFIKAALFLHQERDVFIKTLNTLMPRQFKILYLPSNEELGASIKEWREKEIEAGFSLFGPQKDDFLFLKNKTPLISYGSRGETREAVFFYKRAEWKYIKDKSNTSPVLLLDDIFSELDQKKRREIIAHTQESQTILTTTSLRYLSPELIKKAKIIELKNVE